MKIRISVKKVIPTAQYANIQPELEITTDVPEDKVWQYIETTIEGITKVIEKQEDNYKTRG